VSKIKVLTTISTSTLLTLVMALVKKRKNGLNLKFLGIVRGTMDDANKNSKIRRLKILKYQKTIIRLDENQKIKRD
jgi:hypothetical protein